LGGVFFCDATATLIRRVLKRERLSVAHRDHAYQQLALRWQSHSRVTTLILAVDFIWLLPASFLAAAVPTMAVWVLLMSFLPLGVAVIVGGRGRG
jgi:Fuc2NAc and GlcNAc transferase